MLEYIVGQLFKTEGVVTLFIVFVYFLSTNYIYKTTQEESRLYILGHFGLQSFLIILFSETIPSFESNNFRFHSEIFFFILSILLIFQALLKIKLNGFTAFKKSLLRKRTLFIIFTYLLMLTLLFYNIFQLAMEWGPVPCISC